jgi:hypothetical protein
MPGKKQYRARSSRSTCHKTCYERSAADRQLKISKIFTSKEFCRQCEAWHLTRSKAMIIMPEDARRYIRAFTMPL